MSEAGFLFLLFVAMWFIGYFRGYMDGKRHTIEGVDHGT